MCVYFRWVLANYTIFYLQAESDPEFGMVAETE